MTLSSYYVRRGFVRQQELGAGSGPTDESQEPNEGLGDQAFLLAPVNTQLACRASPHAPRYEAHLNGLQPPSKNKRWRVCSGNRVNMYFLIKRFVVLCSRVKQTTVCFLTDVPLSPFQAEQRDPFLST